MFKKKLSLLLFICTIPTFLMAQSFKIGLPFSQYFPSKSYKGGIQNMEISQGLDGRIYVANNFGLLTYDGQEWEKYTTKIGAKCRYILITETGRIYIAGQGDFGYFSIDVAGQYKYVSLSDKLPEKYKDYDETWRIFKKDNEYIFCTFDYLFYFNESDNLTKVIISPGDIESFYHINNTIITNQKNTGLLELQNDSFKIIPGGSFFSNKKVSSILPISNNQLLISTQKQGIYILNNGKVSIWNSKQQDKFKQASINTIIRLSTGNYALGTLNDGLFITDKNGHIETQLTKGHGLENRTILTVFEDLQHNIWLGHNNGISMVELNNPFTLINEQYGLPGTGYDALLDGNNLLLGTNNALYTTDINSSKHLIKRIENSPGQVYTVEKIYNQILTGQHTGSYKIENESSELISDIAGAWTFLPLKNNPNYILQGNYKGLALFQKNGSKIEFVREIKGFSESSRIMEQDEDGNIWMTHGYKGIFKFALNDALDSVAVKYYGKNAGLPSNVLINVWKVNNQLIFSTERGIYTYQEATDNFVKFTGFDEYLGSDCQIISLTEDAVGNIYYVSSKEIGLLEKSGLTKYTKHTNIFNRIKLLLNDDLQKIIALEANQILFAAKEGFIHYDNLNKYRDNSGIKTMIKQVSLIQNIDSVISYGKYSVDGNISFQQPKNQKIELAFNQNAIRFVYTAPFMEANDKTEFQYWLQGSDEEGFSDWSYKTEKEYTNIHEGSYKFHVRARNVYGNITDDAIYTFTILPPWYRSNLAYIIYLLLGVSFILFVYGIFEKRYQKQTEIITEEKEKEINRIDTELKSSEELIDKLKNEQLEAQIDIQSKELATSTMQIINKNEFINSVKGNLTNVTKRSKNQEVKQEINKIIHNIEKNIASDKDWEHFSLHFDKVHGDFTHRFKQEFPDISPQEMKLSAYLRMNLSTKEIAHLLNISVRGVEIARYRLRKKLQLERSDNLQEFILSY